MCRRIRLPCALKLAILKSTPTVAWPIASKVASAKRATSDDLPHDASPISSSLWDASNSIRSLPAASTRPVPSEWDASPPSSLEQPRRPVSPVELSGEPWQALLRGEAKALASPTRRPTQPIRRRLAAIAPRPLLPRARAASPSPCLKQPWRVSPVEPSEEPWQALLLTEEQALVSLHTDHPGRLDQERHAGAAPSPSWPPGWHLRTVLARAPDSQPVPSSPSPVACASPCLGLQELAAVDAPPAAPAMRVPPADAPAGAASSSRGPRLRPPPARDPLTRRRRPSLARYRLSCVRGVGGKTKIGDPETHQLYNYNISVVPGEPPLLVSIS
eukprot:scaffold1734_cov113-Isochrysis_galbana.AAC.29